ncbi:hypothetical protein KCU86_g9563, partial [Aureobasidium melanogenum]
VWWKCTTLFGTAELELPENLRNLSVNFRTNAFVRCEAQDEALATRAPPYGGSSNMPHTKVAGRDECKVVREPAF